MDFANSSWSRNIKNEVLSACSNIGHSDKSQKYIKDPDCQYSLKECLRFVRRDNNFIARRTLGFANIVTNDLIPLLKQHCVEDELLFDIVLRLLVNLTNPTLLLFKEKIPDDKDEQKVFLELSSYLYQYKVAFSMDVKLYSVIAKHMSRILQLSWEQRQEDHKIMLERILVLIRNILHVPVDAKCETGTDEDANVHDLCIQTMHLSGINDLLLFIANSDSETQFCFHVLEIMSLMMREQNAEFLAKSSDRSSLDDAFNRRNFFERQKDSQNLKELLIKDRSLTNFKKTTNFNRFKEATYLVKNMKSLSDKDVIFHKTPSDISTITFDSQKKRVRKPKNRAPLKDETSATHLNNEVFVHRSTFKIRKYLRDFCSSFIMDSYNDVMRIVRDNLERKRGQENDETYYLWATQFFMEFCRCMKLDTQNVSETLSMESFHYIHTLIEHYVDNLAQEKKHFHPWSRRLHYALKTYRELLFTLSSLDANSNSKFRELGREMKKRIFYEIEYRELLLHLIVAFNPVKTSFSYLRDLVETNHLFLKMLEHYCGTNEKVIVKQKQRKKPTKKPKNSSETSQESSELLWTEITVQVSETLQGGIQLPTVEENPEVNPIDGTSEKPLDEQKLLVMSRIHKMLRSKRIAEGVALYRNAREAWSDDFENAFGSSGITFEEELMNLQEILFNDFLAETTEDTEQDDEVSGINDEAQQATTEKEFLFLDFLRKYMTPKVVIALSSLLQRFEQNSRFTNHCIIKLFHRTAWDNKMHAMFFQLSLFRTFQKILNLPSHHSEDIIEISKFAKFIINKFFEVSKKNKKAFAEFLFWKNSKVAYELEEGYGTSATTKTKSKGKRGRKKGSNPENSSDDERGADSDHVENFEYIEQTEQSERIEETVIAMENDQDEDENAELLKKQLLINDDSDDEDLAGQIRNMSNESDSDDENNLVINEDPQPEEEEIEQHNEHQLEAMAISGMDSDQEDDNKMNISKRKSRKANVLHDSDDEISEAEKDKSRENIEDGRSSETRKVINSDDEDGDEITKITRSKRAKLFDDEMSEAENNKSKENNEDGRSSETRKRSDSDDEDGDEIMKIIRNKRAKLFESDSESD